MECRKKVNKHWVQGAEIFAPEKSETKKWGEKLPLVSDWEKSTAVRLQIIQKGL